jgi:uncharacterized coiled-coil protein SlyX
MCEELKNQMNYLKQRVKDAEEQAIQATKKVL